jgi:penicillin amidase
MILRFGGRLLAFVFVLAGIVAAFAFSLVYVAIPDAREDLAIPGLQAPVAVTLDGHGIPHITAGSDRDAAMALGWLHARDRMFQMETMRRGAEGRLAELAGPAALRLDRFTRTLGLAQRAAADFETLPDEARDMLEAYATGVNARLAVVGRLAAPEFLVIGEPPPWKPRDSLLWAKVMGLWLSGNWRRELENARLAATLPPERLRLLWPEDTSPGRPDLQAALDPAFAGRVLAQVPVFGVDAPLPDSASNAWAVVPARSASGGALLASDPHLGFQAPILWYLARINLPDGRFRAGATAPGVPGVVIGRNEAIAWGFTTTHSDTQDVFVERLVGSDAYETPEGPRPFTVREERIPVRGEAEPVLLRVRESRHGPIISDLDDSAPAGTVLAVAMANLAPNDTAAAAITALNRATTLAEARAAAALISSPPQNLIVADRAGGIAMYLVGRTPMRRSGDGTLPARGWDGSQDWAGFVPFDAMPHVENPESGIVANANSRPAPADHPVFLGRDWYGDWRLRRIGELLAATPRHTPSSFGAMQSDTVSLLAREALPVLRAVTPSAGAAPAHALLAEWQGEMAADLPQPLLFHAWMRRFRADALAAAGVTDAEAGARPEFLRLLLDPARSRAWCGPTGCEPLLAPSLDAAVAALREAHGSDPRDWRWGAVHVAAFEHPLLRFVPVLSGLTRLAVPTGGDGETLSRGGLRGEAGGDFAHVHGAGFRGVFDLADPDGVHVMIATGQSGHPLSDRYGDLLPMWQRGALLRLGRQPAGETGRITLRP